MKQVLRRAVVTATGVLALTALVTAGAGSQNPLAVLKYGMTLGTIDEANPNDARAGSLLFARGIADALGLYRTAEAEVFPSPGAAVSAVDAAGADLVAISTMEYFSVENRLRATPALAWEVSGSATVEYLLLARNDSAGLPAAAGKSLVVYAPNRPWALSDVWVDVLIAEAGLAGGRQAFSSIKFVAKRGHAAMAVFFGQADYGIETLSAFKMNADLNPQMVKALKVLSQSPPLLTGMVCLADHMSSEVKRRYVEKATQLHERARYQQAFMVMRVTRLVAWQPRFLDSARVLLNKHRAINGRR